MKRGVCIFAAAAAVFVLAAAGPVFAKVESVTVPVSRIGQDTAMTVGTVTFSDSAKGLTIVTKLKGLPPGPHGFHIHELPDCGAKAVDGKMMSGMAAGGHFDPLKTGKHMGPGHMKEGHLGDLPMLMVDAKGNANVTLLVPGLTVGDIRNRSVMIHAGGDNFADAPAPLGGGGARIACGVIK